MSSGKDRVVVLISGRGSNMAALVEASRAADYPAEVVAVISNKPDAAGLDYAAREGIATAVVPHKGFASREAFDAALDAEIRKYAPDFICLAGFMRLLTPGFSESWAGKLINIHPSLLPSFKGLDTHERALEAGVKLHGCTVHLVTPDLDSGPMVAQAAVPVLAGDTPESLGARVLKAEHKLYPAALALLVSGRARLVDGHVIIEQAADASAALFNPAL